MIIEYVRSCYSKEYGGRILLESIVIDYTDGATITLNDHDKASATIIDWRD